MKKLLFTISTALLLCGAFANGAEFDFGDLTNYEKANPHDDLKIAISQNDLRFISIMAIGLYIPGIDDYHEKYQKYGNKTIHGAGDLIFNYEHGRLIAIAEHYARTYNLQLQLYICELESKKLSKSINGYDNIDKLFTVRSVRTGNINSLPHSFTAKLSSNNNKCVNLAWWFNPIEDNKPLYDWNHFIQIFNEVNSVSCQHMWLKKWVKSGEDRNLEAQIFGIRPFTETEKNMDFFVKTAWEDASLRSEPFYEINLREGQKCKGTLYIAKDASIALIVTIKPSKGSHWLDKMDFSYHPKSEKLEYIVVDKEGHWSKKKN